MLRSYVQQNLGVIKIEAMRALSGSTGKWMILNFEDSPDL